MTQPGYTAALDSYIPRAQKWADQQTNVPPSKRKTAKSKWDRHFSYAMDEARRRLGRKHSYDLSPRLLRPPHYEHGQYSSHELATWLVRAATAAEFNRRYPCDLATAKARFHVTKFGEAQQAAQAWLDAHNLGEEMAAYTRELSMFFDAEYLDKAG